MTPRHMALWLGATALVACSGSPPDNQATPASIEANVAMEPPASSSGQAAAVPTTPKRLTRAQLREKARTDPDGADAQAISQMSRNELVATSINSAGFLCARVTDLYPSGDDIIAHCVEYRSGTGRVSYRINARAGSVEQME